MPEPIYLLNESGKADGFSHFAKTLRTTNEVEIAFRSVRRARWIALDKQALHLLDAVGEPSNTWHRLLVLDALGRARRELLSSIFRVVLAPDEGVRLVAQIDLEEILAAPHPEDYFIGGIVDAEDGRMVLYRGDFTRLSVPLTWFASTKRSPRPDFTDFDVTDSGQTLRFGQYEAAADAVLYELDRDARRRMKERELSEDHSLGGSIRRLRLSKGLSRTAFSGVDAKTIARIERGEVGRPQEQTLDSLAKRLGVPVGDLGSY